MTKAASLRLNGIQDLNALGRILSGLATSIDAEPTAAEIRDPFAKAHDQFLTQVSTNPRDAITTVRRHISPLVRGLENKIWCRIISRFGTLDQCRLQVPEQALSPRADRPRLVIDCEDDAQKKQFAPLLSWFQELVIDSSVWRGSRWPFFLGPVALSKNLVEAQTVEVQVKALAPDSDVGLRVERVADPDKGLEVPRFIVDHRRDLSISPEVLATLLFNCHLQSNGSAMELSLDKLLQPAHRINHRYYPSVLRGIKTTNPDCGEERTILSAIQKELLANNARAHLLPRFKAMKLDSSLLEKVVALIEHVPMRIFMDESYLRTFERKSPGVHLSLRHAHVGDMRDKPTLFINLEIAIKIFPRGEDALWNLIAKALVQWLKQDNARQIKFRSTPKAVEPKKARFVVHSTLVRELDIYPSHDRLKFDRLLNWLAQMKSFRMLPPGFQRIYCAVGNDLMFCTLVRNAIELMPAFVSEVFWTRPNKTYPADHIIIREDPKKKDSWRVIISAPLPDFLSRDYIEWMELVTLALQQRIETFCAGQTLTKPYLFPLMDIEKNVNPRVLKKHRSLWHKLRMFWEYEQLPIKYKPSDDLQLDLRGGERAAYIFEQMHASLSLYQQQYNDVLLQSVRERPHWLLGYYDEDIWGYVVTAATIITVPGARFAFFNKKPELTESEWQRFTERLVAAPEGKNRFTSTCPDVGHDPSIPRLSTEEYCPGQNSYDDNATYRKAGPEERQAYREAFQWIYFGALAFALETPSPTMSYRDLRKITRKLIAWGHPDHVFKGMLTEAQQEIRSNYKEVLKAIEILERIHRHY